MTLLVTRTCRAASPEITTSTGAYEYTRTTAPPGVVVRDLAGTWLATFTDGAYTVRLHGPERVFSERTETAVVRHRTWIRTVPQPFAGTVDTAWLTAALQANRDDVPDVLGIAMQYIDAAPPLYHGSLQIAGDADYGPLQANGTRQEGADFNDYLGLSWSYDDGRRDPPEPRQLHSLDCSGFMRMVWGYRHHLPGFAATDTVPLTLQPRADHSALPRRAAQIYEAAPGLLLIADTGERVKDLSALRIGDLVFFNADEHDGTQLDHVGMYLGVDDSGHHRFISSRKSINGPTLGDYQGASVLDGRGYYATAFRAARRL